MNRYPSHNTMYWAIWAFAVAFIVVILWTAIAAGREELAKTGSNAQTLSAPSADFGSTMEASPVRLGVGAPGSARRENQNAVESILSHDLRWTASWCGFADKTILQGIATGVATMLPARGQSRSTQFSGVPADHGGAGCSCARESNTAFPLPAHAAPEFYFAGRAYES
jgi:hypothetical protein